jgi:hypothetical protein
MSQTGDSMKIARNAIHGIANISKKQDQARVPGSILEADVNALIR